MHGLEEFSFSQYKKATPKKSPCILKYKDTFFPATFLLHIFEAAFFFPYLFQLTYYFICSYQQLHLHRWEAHTVTFTPCNYLLSKAVSELNQMMLILKASKIALLAAFELLPRSKKNCLQKCLQLSLTVLSFKNKICESREIISRFCSCLESHAPHQDDWVKGMHIEGVGGMICLHAGER